VSRGFDTARVPRSPYLTLELWADQLRNGFIVPPFGHLESRYIYKREMQFFVGQRSSARAHAFDLPVLKRDTL